MGNPLTKRVKSNAGVGEFGLKESQAYTVVLKSGSTHNIVLKSFLNKSFSDGSDFVIVGNIAIEKAAILEEKRAEGGRLDVEFVFWNDANKKANVIQSDRVFICVNRVVLIPSDNIGLIEESSLPCFESKDFSGENIFKDNKTILSKLPHWKHYYSLDLDGFFATPPIIKGIPSNQELLPSVANKFSVINNQSNLKTNLK